MKHNILQISADSLPLSLVTPMGLILLFKRMSLFFELPFKQDRDSVLYGKVRAHFLNSLRPSETHL